MKARLILYRFQALLLVLCLLPITAAAGVADSSALAYEKAVQMLTTSSLTDGEKLEVIRAQFEQAGSYQFGIDYLTLTDALMILQAGNANRFDDALDIVQRLSRNENFTRHYSSYVDRAGQPILPDLDTLAQYIMARKLEAYQDLTGAVMLYDQYPVLDAAYRAGLLTSSIKLSQYEKAMDLLQEGSPESIQRASVIFEELGYFRDSRKRLQECRERMEAIVTPIPSPEMLSNAFEEEPLNPTPTLRQPNIGEIILFGHYEQDNNITNGREPIAWRVLEAESNHVLLISEQNLDSQPYNNQYISVTWETCRLRKWLNSYFVDTAFTHEEQKSILTSLVNNDDGRDTQDMIFLLSIDEAENLFTRKVDRDAKNTAYANAQGAYSGTENSGWWWLRSSGKHGSSAAHVIAGGSIYRNGTNVNNDRGAIRPALWLDLTSP